MKVCTGTSGYGYKEWKGSFYPEKISAGKMLAFYAERLGAVELNSTFYRMPNIVLAETWAAQVPRGFMFAVKAPQVITHIKRLRGVGEETRYFLGALAGLKSKLGAVLFQFPASFREDRGLLEKFLGLLPSKTPCAFEFKSPSWLNQGTYDLLGEKGFSLCNADTEEAPVKEIVSTSAWGYLRLRRPDYPEAALSEWAEKIASQKWEKAFVFFKHEDGAAGPGYAAGLSGLIARGLAAGSGELSRTR